MKIPVLDHGYVELIEPWGTGRDGHMAVGYDQASGQHGDYIIEPDYEVGIIEAARQSTQKGFQCWTPMPCNCPAMVDINATAADCMTVSHTKTCDSVKHPGDVKLLKYLYDHKHNTPFEFAGMVIEVQAPIFVFREWHRHRTQSYNEMSARYAPLPDLYYMPDESVTRQRFEEARSTKNKQASSDPLAQFAVEYVDDWRLELHKLYSAAEDLYQLALTNGIPKELARLVMPVGHYSRMRASANLRNWLAFLTLRMDPSAQWEIRQFANAVGQIIASRFPRTWQLFNAARNT